MKKMVYLGFILFVLDVSIAIKRGSANQRDPECCWSSYFKYGLGPR